MAETDIDGDPLSTKMSTPPSTAQSQPAFIRSKWEEVDETELQAQG